MKTAELDTMERINQLSTERASLYRQASNGGRSNRAAAMERIKAIGTEIEALWEQRRVDRIGKREGIDLVIDKVYEHTYGKGYEEVTVPTVVDDRDEASFQDKSLILAA